MSRQISRHRRFVRFGCFDTLTAVIRQLRSAVLIPVAVVVAIMVTTASLALGATAAAAAPERSPSEPNTAVFSGTANSANARFVVAGYQQLLGREADTGGLDFHISRMTAGGDRTRKAFTYSMLFSVEGSRQEVRRAYLGLLGRSADTTGEDYWTAHLQGHGVLDLRVLLMSSDEYFRYSGDNAASWIEALYLDILGRGSDADGLEYWLDQMNEGVARPLIVAGLYLSDESLGRRVDSYFQESLGRSPSDSERTASIGTIRREGERGLRAEIWSSDEVYEQYLNAALS